MNFVQNEFCYSRDEVSGIPDTIQKCETSKCKNLSPMDNS